MRGFRFLSLVIVVVALTSRPSLASVAVTVRPEVPVTAVDLSVELANNSPSVVVDPTDPRFMVVASRVDAPRFDCLLHVSGDGGRSWLPSRPVPELPRGVDSCYAPEVGFDRNGVLYYLFVGLKRPANTPVGAFLTTSLDRRSFSPPRRLLGPDRYMVRMALDPAMGEHGRLHLIWLEANSPPPLGGLPPPPNPILAAYSDDGGRTFSTPVQVSDPTRMRVVAPAVAIGRDGKVHVVYYDLEDDVRDYEGLEGPPWEGTWSLVISTSSDKRTDFERHTLIDSGIVPPQRVMLIHTMPSPSLVSDSADRLWVSWSDARNGDWDVFVARSVDDGRSWAEPIRINDDELGNARHQYLPRLSLAPGGRIDAIFYDRRDDPANTDNHVYYTQSSDGGQHFASNRRLTSEASHSGTGARYAIPSAAGLIEFGSRIGLVSMRSSAVAAWTDTRNVPPGNSQQDLFATEVLLEPAPASLASSSGGARRSVLLPTLLLGAGLVIVSAWRGREATISRRWPARSRGRGMRSRSGSLIIGRQLSVILAVLVPLASACGAQRPKAHPPSVPIVNVVMREYRFEHSDVLPQGRAIFRVRNADRVDHAVTLVRLPDDLMLSIRELLRSETRRAFPTTARLLRRPPGSEGVFAVDLQVGRYAMLCFITDADGSQHVEKGMASEFEVA